MECHIADDPMIKEVFAVPSENQELGGAFIQFVWYRQIEFPQ
jgi:hypothetical protein